MFGCFFFIFSKLCWEDVLLLRQEKMILANFKSRLILSQRMTTAANKCKHPHELRSTLNDIWVDERPNYQQPEWKLTGASRNLVGKILPKSALAFTTVMTAEPLPT